MAGPGQKKSLIKILNFGPLSVRKMDAINWIVGLHPEFVNYCKMLGMDTDTIRSKIIANVDMSYTQKQKFKIKSEEKFFA